jgi:hypothetical protein
VVIGDTCSSHALRCCALNRSWWKAPTCGAGQPSTGRGWSVGSP